MTFDGRLFIFPFGNGGLFGRDATGARYEIGAGLQALLCELQTHEAELHLAARTEDVLAARLVVLHLNATGGARPDGRAGTHPLHLGQQDGATFLQQLQVVVDAAVVVAAVGAGRLPLPRLQTLPAELPGGLPACLADSAVETEIVLVRSFHNGPAPRALFGNKSILLTLNVSVVDPSYADTL